MKRGISKLLILLGLFLVSASFALAVNVTGPTGPDDITNYGSTRRSDKVGGFQLEAEAGNVTSIEISDTRQTRNWQGYYGNITGRIVLDDALNNTFYAWELAKPTGEVYAANGSSVQWGLVKCANFSTYNDSSQFGPNLTTIENFFQINFTDKDGLNETFNETYTNGTGFLIGQVRINTQSVCPLVHTFKDEAWQQDDWEEVLLTDNDSLIFTALIESDVEGFRSGADPHDFQLLVAENGQPGQETTTTTYYFYVELA